MRGDSNCWSRRDVAYWPRACGDEVNLVLQGQGRACAEGYRLGGHRRSAMADALATELYYVKG